MTQRMSHKLINELVLPVIAAPMFLVSSPDMVLAACKAGIIGSFPSLNARSVDILDSWMLRITDELAQLRKDDPERPAALWAVNLIVHKSNKRFEEDLALIKKHHPPIVITSLGDPTPVIRIVQEYEGLVFSDVTTIKHAKKAVQKGVDGLILVCNGAGGHAGTLNPLAFMSAVKEFWDGLIILAGCISSGQDILAAEALGADLAYMGTRFIATTESFAHSEYQEMLVEATLEDLMNTDAFTGVPANYLIPSIRRAGLDPELLQKKESLDFSQLHAAGAKAWKDIWSAGQGVGNIKEILPVAAIIKVLEGEYNYAIERLLSKRL